MATDDVNQFANLLASELEAAELRWAKAITKVEFEFADKGAFNGSARVHQTAERLNEGLTQYRQYIFDKWTSYIRPRLQSLGASDQAAFVEAALGALDRATTVAVDQFDARPKPGPSMDYMADLIKSSGQRERQSLEAELRLYLSTPVESPAGVSVVTHGANSPVNMGGTLNQQVNINQAMAEFITALAALLEAMSQVQDHRLDDVRDIVIEAKNEAAKPKPNKLKLQSILGGIKTGIEGVAVLEKAWELVEHATKVLGLPI
jgi:hypothetical protein